MVSVDANNGNGRDEEHDHHVSIASLRSKFETLAHGHIHSRPNGAAPAKAPSSQAVSPATSLASVPSASNPASQASVKAPSAPSGPPSVSSLPVSPSSTGAVSKPSSSRPPPPPKPTSKPDLRPAPKADLRPAPVRIEPPASNASRSSTGSSAGEPSSHAGSPQTITMLLRPTPGRPASPMRSTSPLRATSPLPRPVSPLRPTSPRPPSPRRPNAIVASAPGSTSEGSDEQVPSVKALRERFGQTTQAVASGPRPSSRRASLEAIRSAGGASSDTPVTQQSAPPPPISHPPKATSTLPQPSKSAPQATPAKPPPPPKPLGLPTAATTSAPATHRAKGPPPPPPISRSASPAPPAPEISHQFTASPHASPAGSRAPSPAPPTRSSPPPSSLPHPVASAPPSLAPSSARPVLRQSSPATEHPESVPAVKKPPLPVRKATLPAVQAPPTPDRSPPEHGAPPPIPGNRPAPVPAALLAPSSATHPPAALSSSPSSDHALSSRPPLPANKPAAPTLVSPPTQDAPKPPLPARQRSNTLKTEPTPIPRPTPPRLPVRQNTLGTSPARQNSLGSSLSDGYIPPPPPPLRSAAASAPPSSFKRSGTISAPGPGYAAPPARRSSVSSELTPPVRRAGGTQESWSDDDDEGGPVQPLTTMAQRLIDEHPDATEANRRPPQFVPDVRLSTAQSITAFAVYGRYACVAHHHVKVFDTTMGSEPIVTFDPRHADLELRVKEPRVTAMGFRPSCSRAHDGRYLWCGNKDGHLWEVDIHTGEVTATRPFVHAAPVTYILRYQRWVITIDEGGKLHVWEVQHPTNDDEDSGNFKISRTLRVSERITFAKMINGKLWTATAPTVRSATTNSASARGPTIRVYDPVAQGNTAPALGALTSEWTGAATAATVMPLDPAHVYIGHEGGFVSRWTLSEDEVVCQQVLKISTTDILSLEGVGERLWAGNRRGQIHVFDISQKPWITTNIWTAHAEQPVHSLVVDPYGIEAAGRFMLWSCSRDQLRAWDGLLAVDWIDTHMVERQQDYCDFRDIRVLVCSWNIDSAKPTDMVGAPENAHFLDEVLGSVESPDIIVFGFQEVIPLTDKKLTAKTLLFGKGKEGATNDRVSGAYRAWAEKLQYAVRLASGETPYIKVNSEQLVGLFSCMFVKSSIRDSLRDVNITTVKRGIGGIYGNKGAIVARMVVDDTSICFINVHLAAGQRHRAARNADIGAIMEDKAIFPPADKLPFVHGGDGTGILDHEMVVLNGDLNYRIDQRRDMVVQSIRAGDLPFLLEHDQLNKEMRGNHAFRLRRFSEAPITFPPTYKYDPGTNDYDTSEKRRIPAWCDRILFTRTRRIQPLIYRRYETTLSDHKPVSAGLVMQVKRVDPMRMREVHAEVSKEWAKREDDLLTRMIAAYEALY